VLRYLFPTFSPYGRDHRPCRCRKISNIQRFDLEFARRHQQRCAYVWSRLIDCLRLCGAQDKSTELTSRSMGELSAEDMADMSKKDKTEALGLEAEVYVCSLVCLERMRTRFACVCSLHNVCAQSEEETGIVEKTRGRHGHGAQNAKLAAEHGAEHSFGLPS